MSNGNALAARCSHCPDAMHRIRDFNARRLRQIGAFLRAMQKPAWLKGFCIVVLRSLVTQTHTAREILSLRRYAQTTPPECRRAVENFFHRQAPKARSRPESGSHSRE